ncbi:hypothetical protein DYH09_14540 [bacterium CPR1]|nr:hypothetical protein [bacterium CPR1]
MLEELAGQGVTYRGYPPAGTAHEVSPARIVELVEADPPWKLLKLEQPDDPQNAGLGSIQGFRRVHEAAVFLLGDSPESLAHPGAARALQHLHEQGWGLGVGSGAEQAPTRPLASYQWLDNFYFIYKLRSPVQSTAPDQSSWRLIAPDDATVLDVWKGGADVRSTGKPDVARALKGFLDSCELEPNVALRIGACAFREVQHAGPLGAAEAVQAAGTFQKVYQELLAPQAQAGRLSPEQADYALTAISEPVEGTTFQERAQLYVGMLEAAHQAPDASRPDRLALDAYIQALAYGPDAASFRHEASRLTEFVGQVQTSDARDTFDAFDTVLARQIEDRSKLLPAREMLQGLVQRGVELGEAWQTVRGSMLTAGGGSSVGVTDSLVLVGPARLARRRSRPA